MYKTTLFYYSDYSYTDIDCDFYIYEQFLPAKLEPHIICKLSVMSVTTICSNWSVIPVPLI